MSRLLDRLSDAFISAISLGMYTPAQAETAAKSIRDGSTDLYGTGSGASVFDSVKGKHQRIFPKKNVALLRNYAENSVWVRAAIDIYRNTIGQAAHSIGPHDPARPMKEAVRKRIVGLFDKPNQAETPYSTLKAQFIEDFLVIGHGAIEKIPARDLAPSSLLAIDSAKIGFIKGWDGTDPKMPRYCEINLQHTTVSRWFPDAYLMTMVNRPRSYDCLGLSHVEVLDRTVRALLEGDDYLINNVLNPTPTGALDLGQGVTPQQVMQVRAQIENVRRAFLVMGGTTGSKFVRFNATEREMKVLDTQGWFLKEVAAVFQIPTAMLASQVDLSRANLDSQLSNAQEGLGATLWEVRNCERQSIILKFGSYEEHNCDIDYPVMNRRDEKGQAEISKTQTGGRAWVSINEARRDGGKETVPLPIADEILVDTPDGPIPLSLLQRIWDESLDPDPNNDDNDAGDEVEDDDDETAE